MSGLQNVNFLIVDDNYHMRRIVLTILRGFGVASVIEAADAADAFEILQGHPVDIIITDYNMQPLDGLDFTRLIRQSDDHRYKFIPIILLTAHSERRFVLEARDAGVTEFCRKPVSAKDLFVRIRSVVENPRPFIKSKQFFGPDRRRRHDSISQELQRRRSDSDAE